MSLNVKLSIIIGRVKVGSGSSNSADGIALPHHRTRSVLLTILFLFSSLRSKGRSSLCIVAFQVMRVMIAVIRSGYAPRPWPSNHHQEDGRRARTLRDQIQEEH